MRNDIERAVDTTLSGLRVDAARQTQLIRNAMNASTGSTKSARPRGLKLSMGFPLPHVAVAALVIILATLVPLLKAPQKDPFVRYSSEDGQDYIVSASGEATPQPGAIADSTLYTAGNYHGTSFEEADLVYGERLPRFGWLPEKATLTDIYVDVYEQPPTRDILIRYEFPHGSCQLLISDIAAGEGGMFYIFQDGEGEYRTLQNGQEVYITTNGSRQVIVWQKGYTIYQLSCNVTLEEAIRMAESIR